MTEENLQKQDVKLAIGKEEISDIIKTLQEKRKISGRVGSYEFKGTSRINFGDRGLFKQCEYDLAEIGRAVDIEAYIGQSVRKHREQILKEGFKLSGIDDNLIEYIENRLFEIALITGITTAQTLRDVVLNLVMYHNAYIVFRRDKYRSTGKPIMMYGKTLQPIAGMFVPDPTTMECEVDKYGTIKRYRQTIPSLHGEEEKEKIYPVEDVVHITMDKKSGYSYGTPYILPVLDDIRALRKLEELVVVLASKEAFPLYHYKIGTEEAPAIVYEDGTSEIDVIEGKISGLPQQGYIVTSERIEVKVVSRDGSGLDIKPYLEYFEKRVLAGLRLSEVDLGRGGTSNRGTASTINKNMQDAAKDYQAVISDILTYKLILPLLLEGGFDITIKNLVLFMFPAIDAEEQRAHISHGLSLYEASVIDLHEFRKEYLNKKPMSDEQMSQTARMFAHEGDKELTNLAGSFKASTSTGVTKKTSNTVRPENQSGKTTKKRITKNDFSEVVLEKIKEIKLNLLNQQDYSKEEVSSYLQTSVSDLVNLCVENSKADITDSIKEGWQSAREEYESFNKSGEVDIEYIGNRAIDRFFKNFVHKSYWITINPFLDAINTCIADKELADQDFRYLTYIEDIYTGVKNLLKMQTKTANRFGYCSYVKRVGYKSIDVIDKDNNVLRTIDLSSGIIYTNLFPKEEDKKLIFLPRNIQDSNKEQNV